MKLTGKFKVLLVASTLVIAGCTSDRASSEESSNTDTNNSQPSVLINAESTLQPVLLTSADCSVLAPENWIIQASDYSGGMTATDPEKELAVQLNLIPVAPNFGMDLSLNLPPYNDERMFSEDPHEVILAFMENQLSNAGLPTDLTFTNDPAQTIAGYTVELAKTSKGFYRFIWMTVPGDGVNINYILNLRVAAAPNEYWDQYSGLISQIAATQKCSLQDLPSAQSEIDTTSSENSTSGDQSTDEGYNPWLGSEWVHDGDTGENYLVTTNDWSNTGTDGPGYYKQNNNDIKKLIPGRNN